MCVCVLVDHIHIAVEMSTTLAMHPRHRLRIYFPQLLQHHRRKVEELQQQLQQLDPQLLQQLDAAVEQGVFREPLQVSLQKDEEVSYRISQKLEFLSDDDILTFSERYLEVGKGWSKTGDDLQRMQYQLEQQQQAPPVVNDVSMQSPSVQQASSVHQAPVMEQDLVVMEQSLAVVEQVPSVQQAPVVEQDLAVMEQGLASVEQVPSVQQAPSVQQVPSVQQASSVQQAPVVEQDLAVMEQSLAIVEQDPILEHQQQQEVQQRQAEVRSPVRAVSAAAPPAAARGQAWSRWASVARKAVGAIGKAVAAKVADVPPSAWRGWVKPGPVQLVAAVAVPAAASAAAPPDAPTAVLPVEPAATLPVVPAVSTSDDRVVDVGGSNWFSGLPDLLCSGDRPPIRRQQLKGRQQEIGPLGARGRPQPEARRAARPPALPPE